VIVFRNADWRYPFLWETAQQPAARYNHENDGPAQYFADTSDGAWAEFVRHAEITDPEELGEIKRALWCVEIEDVNPSPNSLPIAQATGDKTSYAACQNYARSLRSTGQKRIHQPSASLIAGGARGQRVNNGLQDGPHKDGAIVVLFDYLPTVTGWLVAIGAPPDHVLNVTRHF
jgi:hypothetical protein